MKQQRAYKFRFYPTPGQVQLLARTFGCARYVYNFALRLRTDAYYKEHRRVGYHETSAALTLLKKQADTTWLNEVASVPLQQSIRHLDRAFRNFFAGRAGYPTCKKKQHQQSVSYVGTAFKWDGQSLTLAKIDGSLDVHWSRPLPKDCKPTTVAVTKDCANRYFVSILLEEDITPLPVVNKHIGLDLGLKSMVITSDGQTSGNPRFFAQDEQQLEYKATWYGRTLVKIDRWYPSSKRCFDCGHLLDSLPLDIRQWVCPVCGVAHDRDINAAKNIVAAGQAVLACGEAIRPGRAKAQTGKLR